MISGIKFGLTNGEEYGANCRDLGTSLFLQDKDQEEENNNEDIIEFINSTSENNDVNTLISAEY